MQDLDKLAGWELEQLLMNELDQEREKHEYLMTAFEALLVKYKDSPRALNIIDALMVAEGGLE